MTDNCFAGQIPRLHPNSAQLAETYHVDFNAEVFQQALPLSTMIKEV